MDLKELQYCEECDVLFTGSCPCCTVKCKLEVRFEELRLYLETNKELREQLFKNGSGETTAGEEVIRQQLNQQTKSVKKLEQELTYLRSVNDNFRSQLTDKNLKVEEERVGQKQIINLLQTFCKGMEEKIGELEKESAKCEVTAIRCSNCDSVEHRSDQLQKQITAVVNRNCTLREEISDLQEKNVILYEENIRFVEELKTSTKANEELRYEKGILQIKVKAWKSKKLEDVGDKIIELEGELTTAKEGYYSKIKDLREELRVLRDAYEICLSRNKILQEELKETKETYFRITGL